MNRAEREKRDRRIVRLAAAGLPLAEIADLVGLRSATSVATVVNRELAVESRRAMTPDRAVGMLLERQEELLRGHFARAVAGDHRSALVCLRVMNQQARVVEAMTGLDDDDDFDTDDDDGDELAKYRRRA